MTRLLSLLFLAVSAFAQNVISVRVVENGVESVAIVARGADAAAGIDIARQWMATLQICTPVPEVPAERDGDGNVTKPGTPASQNCVPKFANVAEVGKAFILGNIQQLSNVFVSSALKADDDEIKAKQAALKQKRDAMFERSQKEKP